ncbi:MAG TPA: methyltransferase domain-containing protein [Stellaceae bacterium]|nr:methyltransferase domain-containing protein [Stellaceae bacterium]
MRALFGWNEAWYRGRYPDVAAACDQGGFADALRHFLTFGLREGRYPSAVAESNPIRYDALRRRKFMVGETPVPLDWPITGEPANTFVAKLVNGFFAKYLAGEMILDIGYKGTDPAAVPILPHAVGVDLDYPGYDGLHLPMAAETVDAVFASHVLEHILDYRTVIADWHRVLRLGGYIVCAVPHQFLYEKKRELPSRWNRLHHRFYTPARLLREFEESLPPNSYRVRLLCDNDLGYLYGIPPEHHAAGSYEIELVVEKIEPPAWTVD